MKHLFFSFFIMKRHLQENFLEGGERDDVDDVMMIRTSVSSIIYSKEIDNWITNWPQIPPRRFFPVH